MIIQFSTGFIDGRYQAIAYVKREGLPYRIYRLTRSTAHRIRALARSKHITFYD